LSQQWTLIFDVAWTPFQADDEGSIPFTRSNLFNGSRHKRAAILAVVLLLTDTRPAFVRLLDASACRWQPASSGVGDTDTELPHLPKK
jgi:hypothetical protein